MGKKDEERVTMIVTRENTTITSGKVTDKRLVVMYSTISEDRVIHNTVEMDISVRVLHDDMRGCLNRLGDYMKDIMGFNKEVVLVGTGVSLGNGENDYVLKGKLSVSGGNTVGLSTGVLYLGEGGEISNNGDIKVECELFLAEVFNYLFLNKTPQTTIEFPPSRSIVEVDGNTTTEVKKPRDNKHVSKKAGSSKVDRVSETNKVPLF